MFRAQLIPGLQTVPMRDGKAGHRLRPYAALVSMAVAVSACTAATVPEATDLDAAHEAQVECLLGLDLWDTDPALTWIEDGRVWVRAGNGQACLAPTDAVTLEWSPDGRRLLLGDTIVEGDWAKAGPDASDARQVVWQQPLGNDLLMVSSDGAVHSYAIASGETTAASIPGDVAAVASHPDGNHVVVVDRSGGMSLVSGATGEHAELLSLRPDETVLQIEFSPDGARLWVLVEAQGDARAIYVDLSSIADSLELEPSSPLVQVSPELLEPDVELFFLIVDLTLDALDLESGVGAAGADITGFALHPTHRDWIVVTQGECGDATSSLFVDGALAVEGVPGAAVGFFRGSGSPILATTTSGAGCGDGELWVTTGLPASEGVSHVLVSENVSSVDIRDEAPDPWNPNTAPPFA